MPGSSGSGTTAEIARHFGRLFGQGTLTGLTDRQLLDRFRATGDDAAFALLVARHGPMVLGLCRSLLRDPDEADDVFQAAFLMLARRAGSIRDHAGVGGWLYRVSRRMALRASASASARSRRFGRDPVEPVADDDDDPAGTAARHELRRLVHEELARLSDVDRAVVVLCDLEGLTHEEAARHLRWPLGTVKGRLSRARDRLRSRLVRRGVAPAAITGAILAADDARAAVSPDLLRRTIGVVTDAAGAVPARVAVFTSGALRTMLWTKAVPIALGLGLLAAAVAVGNARTAGGEPLASPAAEPPGSPPSSRDDDVSKDRAVLWPAARRFQGGWRLVSKENRHSIGTKIAETPYRFGILVFANAIEGVLFDSDGSVVDTADVTGPRVRFFVDDRTTPGRIDVVYRGGVGEEIAPRDERKNQAADTEPRAYLARGLYKFEGDDLIYVLSRVGDPRPTTFDFDDGPAQLRFVYRRVPPRWPGPLGSLPALNPAPTTPAAPDPAQPPPQPETSRLDALESKLDRILERLDAIEPPGRNP